jgi:hypothetical protein
VEPFRVTCETCHARLKVSSASVVGQIHACPKCGSMVEIKPPGESRVAPATSGNSVSIEIGAAAGASFEDVPSPFVAPIESTAVTPTAKSSTSYLMWVFAGAAVVAVGGILAVVLVNSGDAVSDTEPSSTSTTAAPTAEVQLAPPTANTAANESSVEAIVPNRIEEGTATAESADAAQAPRSASPAEEPTIQVAEPANERIAVEATAPPVVVDALPSSEPAAKLADRAAVLAFDPFDFDPTQLRLAPRESPSHEPAASSIPENANIEAEPATADDNTLSEMPIPAPAHDLSLMVRRGRVPIGSLSPQQVAERLGMEIESLDVSEAPLWRFVAVLSELADVPITLDPTALELAGKSASEPITASG